MHRALVLVLTISLIAVALADTFQYPGIWEGPLPRLNVSTPSTTCTRKANSSGSTCTTDNIDARYFQRNTLYFPCKGEVCEAWFYLPKKSPCSRPPVVVLAHGIGGQKDMSLHLYAARYAKDGFASFVFDYRTFGGSSGEPRLWVSPRRHLQDWDEALTYLKVSKRLHSPRSKARDSR